ncbi:MULTISPECIES: response regulator [Nostoc]|uniref:Response regulator n=1 Tax=Nostoc paludosum FACHB-159 TaxID=2692908 RepID=A0ABR8K4E6_9NOSO|nr:MULTISPECIES: response regulator [Nostoc]MBD2677616.1 response regulator [Nostoc sp. FACHB-857]MBD2733664.1 response regulator [Nostoc paludosum FACHB-159]
MATDRTTNQESELNSLHSLVGILILLVEDEPEIADLLTFILEAAGAEVIALPNAEQALALVETLHPDILLSNMRLPGHDGNWLIEQIRVHSCQFIRELPAIAITSYTREVSKHKALNAGFDRFLVKLESPEKIVDQIVQLIYSEL